MIDGSSHALKIRRAQEQIYAVVDDVKTALKGNLKFAVTDEFDGDKMWLILKWTRVPDLDQTLGVRVGEIVHNLRSALDQLVFALFVDNGNEPRDGHHTYFPLCETPGKWRDDIAQRDPKRGPSPLFGLCEKAITRVQALQPPDTLKASERARYELVVLHRLSNADKHRTMHVVALTDHPRGVILKPKGVLNIRREKWGKTGRQIKVDAEIGRLLVRPVSLDKREINVNVRLKGHSQVVFESGSLTITGVDLERIATWVEAAATILETGFRDPPPLPAGL